MRTSCGLAVCSAAAAALTGLPEAHATAFAVRQQSAYGQGASFAGIAAGGSLSAMFWNPATLMDVEGLAIEAVGTGILGDAEVKLDARPALGFGGSDEGDIAHDALVPSGYAAYRLTERFVLGVGVNSPFGLATEYDDDSILARTGVAGKSEVFSASLNPALSVEVTDWLALAVGVQVQYFDARLSGQALGPLGVSTLKGDDAGLGVTAGIRVTPAPGTEIGLGYRSAIDHRLDGTLNTANAGTFDVDYDGVDLPDIVTLGVRQRITDRLRVMAGAEWSNWSRFDTVEIEGGPPPIDLEFGYDDNWFLSLGGEFDVTPQATLRTGIGYTLSPIDDNVRNYRLPYNDGLQLSAGVGYRLTERVSVDLGYGFVSSRTWTCVRQTQAGRNRTARSRATPTRRLTTCPSRSRRSYESTRRPTGSPDRSARGGGRARQLARSPAGPGGRRSRDWQISWARRPPDRIVRCAGLSV